ncbi:unnamed protein product [Pedinophyceae sp. YPF-701]|nr:unnamed protein product [Pedinophyceae sp. YPF-701]
MPEGGANGDGGDGGRRLRGVEGPGGQRAESALPPVIPDWNWPQDAEKHAVALVVNLDGSACVAIDVEREKELDVVDTLPPAPPGEPQRRRGTVRLWNRDVSIPMLVCMGVSAVLMGIGVGCLYLFFGTSRERTCRPPWCYPQPDETPSVRRALGALADAAAPEAPPPHLHRRLSLRRARLDG